MSKKQKYSDEDVLGPMYEEDPSDEALSGEMPESEALENMKRLGAKPERIVDPKLRKKYEEYLKK